MAMAAVIEQTPCTVTVDDAGPDRRWTVDAQVLLATEAEEIAAEAAAARQSHWRGRGQAGPENKKPRRGMKAPKGLKQGLA